MASNLGEKKRIQDCRDHKVLNGKSKEKGEEEGALIMVGSVLKGAGPYQYDNALYLRIRRMMVSGWGMTEGMIMRTTWIRKVN